VRNRRRASALVKPADDAVERVAVRARLRRIEPRTAAGAAGKPLQLNVGLSSVIPRVLVQRTGLVREPVAVDERGTDALTLGILSRPRLLCSVN
jgi:hypothetical protein